MRLRYLAPLVALVLAACGAYQPPAADDSALAQRQTAVSLQGRPTLAPVESGPVTAPPPRPTPDLSALLAVAPDDPRALGNPAAPVTIIELTDYE